MVNHDSESSSFSKSGQLANQTDLKYYEQHKVKHYRNYDTKEASERYNITIALERSEIDYWGGFNLFYGPDLNPID